MAEARVLLIIARMNVGGPAQLIVGMLGGVDATRYEQILATGVVDDGEEDWFALRSPELDDDPRIRRVASLGRPVVPQADVAAYRELRALIREERPDLVHTHTAKAGLIGRLAALHEHLPVVHTFHGHVLHGYFNHPVTLAVRAIERRLARRTDALLSVGTRVRNELLAAGVGTPDRFTVVPPGVVPPRLAEPAASRAMLDVDLDAPVVAFIGRLAGVKRPDRFLDVAERVAAARPDAVFLVAGGAEPDELRELRARVRQADVRFLGWFADVGALHAAADLIVLTSDNEGMPVSLIEAGMSGRACVATSVGSVGEVVLDGKTGRVVPPDVGALTDAVLGLLNDGALRRRYGAAAREHTYATFGMSRMVATTEAVYDRVLGRA